MRVVVKEVQRILGPILGAGAQVQFPVRQAHRGMGATVCKIAVRAEVAELQVRIILNRCVAKRRIVHGIMARVNVVLREELLRPEVQQVVLLRVGADITGTEVRVYPMRVSNKVLLLRLRLLLRRVRRHRQTLHRQVPHRLRKILRLLPLLLPTLHRQRSNGKLIYV